MFSSLSSWSQFMLSRCRVLPDRQPLLSRTLHHPSFSTRAPEQPSPSSIEDRTPPHTTTSNFRSDRTYAYVGQHDQDLPVQIVFWHGACVDPALSTRNKGGGRICRRHQAASHPWPSISPRQNFTILISFPGDVRSLSWYMQDQLLLGWLKSLILVPVLARVIYCQKRQCRHLFMNSITKATLAA
jgi:hypothetical protein